MLLEVGSRYTFVIAGSGGNRHKVSGELQTSGTDFLEVMGDGFTRTVRIPKGAILEVWSAPSSLAGTVAESAPEAPDGDSVSRSGETLVERLRTTRQETVDTISTFTLDQLADELDSLGDEPTECRPLLVEVFRSVAEFNSATNFGVKHKARRTALNRISAIPAGRCGDGSSPLCLECQAWKSKLPALVESGWERYLHDRPATVELEGLPPAQTYAVRDRSFKIHVTLVVPKGHPDVEMVQLRARRSDYCRGLAPEPVAKMSEKDRVEVSMEVRVDDLGLELGEVVVELFASFRRIDGQLGSTPTVEHIARLGDASAFARIRNPYASYSGGTPVEDPRMFFGRAQLLDDLALQLAEGPLGQCYVLYGQKRSGKSSVLNQLRQRLEAREDGRAVAVEISLGSIDPGGAEASFIQLIIDEFKGLLVDEALDDNREAWWPTDERIALEPILSFRRALRLVKELKRKERRIVHKPVLLIDEFTYVHEYIQEGIVAPSFMRQWKALLQTGEFSAVVAGQDSMPDFIAAYPNEFAVTTSRRLNYLSSSEARALADSPIRTPSGETRYRGDSLDYLISLTGGSPFYLQIVCDRLVRLMNEERASYVTRSLAEAVVNDLVFGRDRLMIDKFDPLITAAGETVAHYARSDYLAFLHEIALATESGPIEPQIVVRDSLTVDIFNDLKRRDVVVMEPDGRCRLGVDLFAKWLRAV